MCPHRASLPLTASLSLSLPPHPLLSTPTLLLFFFLLSHSLLGHVGRLTILPGLSQTVLVYAHCPGMTINSAPANLKSITILGINYMVTYF